MHTKLYYFCSKVALPLPLSQPSQLISNFSQLQAFSLQRSARQEQPAHPPNPHHSAPARTNPAPVSASPSGLSAFHTAVRSFQARLWT